MNAEHCKAYTLLQEQQIDDIHAHGYNCQLHSMKLSVR